MNIVLSCKTVLIYDIHRFICFLTILNEFFYFSCVELLKWDVTHGQLYVIVSKLKNKILSSFFIWVLIQTILLVFQSL